jgi:hypothetical protein
VRVQRLSLEMNLDGSSRIFPRVLTRILVYDEGGEQRNSLDESFVLLLSLGMRFGRPLEMLPALDLWPAADAFWYNWGGDGGNATRASSSRPCCDPEEYGSRWRPSPFSSTRERSAVYVA